MKTKSIKQIKQLFTENKVTLDILNEIKDDERKGVQQILRSYEKQQLKEEALQARFLRMKQFDEQFKDSALDNIAGVDEAGRGPLAGPVVAASVILSPDFQLTGLTDSKQLTEDERNKYYDYIVQHAIDYHIEVVSHEVIDEINILNATKQAMRTSLLALQATPTLGLIDAVALEDMPFAVEAIIKGDEKSLAIAAASVLAKVTRDRLMEEYDAQYPMYGFKQHKGYGTKTHIEAIQTYGISPIHRTSFGPVQQLIKK